MAVGDAYRPHTIFTCLDKNDPAVTEVVVRGLECGGIVRGSVPLGSKITDGNRPVGAGWWGIIRFGQGALVSAQRPTGSGQHHKAKATGSDRATRHHERFMPFVRA